MDKINNSDAVYFTEKFSKIEEDKWCTTRYQNKDTRQCCAMGLCGMGSQYTYVDLAPQTSEPWRLRELFRAYKLNITAVNDGFDSRYQQTTPKARVIAALSDIEHNRVLFLTEPYIKEKNLK